MAQAGPGILLLHVGLPVPQTAGICDQVFQESAQTRALPLWLLTVKPRSLSLFLSHPDNSS